MELRKIVRQAFEKAVEKDNFGKTPQEINQQRSSDFVTCLATILREEFEDHPNTFVLSKDHAKHRTEFGMNELMFDTLVCETTEVLSANGNTKLTCVSRGLLAVESEMAKDSREALYDFNKLVLSSCKSKLFIGPLVPDIPAFLTPLSAAAKHCPGKVYLALIPRPANWKDATGDMVKFWEWDGSDWAKEKSDDAHFKI